MNQKTKNKILEYHNKGLTHFYIATKLRLPKEEVKQVIEEEIKKDFKGFFEKNE